MKAQGAMDTGELWGHSASEDEDMSYDLATRGGTLVEAAPLLD